MSAPFQQEQLLIAAYDMMLALVGEARADDLARTFLQRLLYHTGFSCGVFFLAAEADKPASGVVAQVVGNRALAGLIGLPLSWPDGLFADEAGRAQAVALPEGLFAGAARYRQGLRFPVGTLGTILLFTTTENELDADFSQAFAPVLESFVKAYRAGRLVADHADRLEKEVEERRRAQAALKESERKLWAMLEFLPLAIAAFSEDGRTQYVNAKFVDLFGYDKDRMPTLNAWWQQASTDPESFAALLAKWQSALATAKLYQTDPEPISGMALCKGGTPCFLEMHAVLVGDWMLATVVDLTQRRDLEQAVLQAKEDAERSNAEKSQFIGRVGRDLYSPLNVVMGYAQLLEFDGTLAEAARAHVAEIKVACGQMLEMIRQVIDAAAPKPEARSESSGRPAPPARSRILVAEDYAPNRQLLARQLRKLGYEADFAGDGAEALKMWQATPYALILTDCNMPVMDGLELTSRIRDIERDLGGHVPIVAISANTVRQDVDKCLESGMDAYLSKPVQLEELEKVCAKFALPPTDVAAEMPTSMPMLEALESSPVADKVGSRLRHLMAFLGEVEPQELLRLAEVFVGSLQETLAEIGAGKRNADAAALVQSAHKLKSALRTIGEEALAGQAAAVEAAAKAGDWPTIHDNSPGLIAAVAASIAEIHGELHGLPGRAAVDVGAIVQAMDDWGDLCVLVVDDDAFVREQIANMLGRMGVRRVHQAANGIEALAELGAHVDEIGIVFCDLNMPGMDGLEFIRHFAARKHKIDIAFISGEDSRVLSSAQELAKAQGLNVLGVAVKPIRSAMLYGILGRRGRRREIRRPGKVDGPDISVADISAGIENKQFTAFLQPKVNARDLEVVGLEALARWQHPVHGLIPPGIFIPLAEANGLIEALTMSVFQRALEAGGELHRLGYKLKVAVNYSAQSFGSLELPEFVVASAQVAGLDPKYLIIEVTESGVMSDLTVALEVLSRLRLKGVSLSIDDFGTGYSSMDQLRRIPFSELKIDQSFVRGARHDRTARSILESSVDMARKLNLVTVAEGVETEEDLEIVRSLGCDLVQGFLIARPMPLPDLIEWLRQRPKKLL